MLVACVEVSASKDAANVQHASGPVYSVDSCEFTKGDLAGGSFDIQCGSPAVTGVYKFSNSAGSANSGSVDFNMTFHCLAGASFDDIVNQLSAKRVKGGWISIDTENPFSRTNISRKI